MNLNFRKAILAGAIAAVISAPTFAVERGQDKGSSDAAGKAGSAMSRDGQSTTENSMNQQQNKGQKSLGTAAISHVKSNPVYSFSAESLYGSEIVGMKAEEIGTIKSIVLTKDRRSAYAVVSTGGIFGVGTREVLVSIDELKLAADEKLRMNISQQRLEARKEYQAEQYVELEGNNPIGGAISEFSAFETDDPAQDPAQTPAQTPESSQ